MHLAFPCYVIESDIEEHFDYSKYLYNLVYKQSILTYKKIMLLLQIIPEEFVKRFKGEIPGKITLETKNHCSYIIGVTKQQEKLVLTAGWGNFVETFALQMGDTIVFRYNGNSKFSVIIFDNLGCENALSVVVDPFVAPAQERYTKVIKTVNCSNIHPQSAQMQSPVESMNTSYVPPQPMERQTPTSRVNGPLMELMESPPTKRQRRLQTDKSCQGNMAAINNFSSESSGLSNFNIE
jgi:hypothetical protein